MNRQRIGKRVTTRAELRSIEDEHEWERPPIVHDFPEQGRFEILRALPYDRNAGDDSEVWVLTVRPLCDGPPKG